MIKKLMLSATALLLSFLLVNGVLFLYERPVAWIDTSNGASLAVRKPYSILIHGTEGYSISKIDSNGYTNSDYPLREQYILMMGASHSQGKEIAAEKKYSELVNTNLTKGTSELAVYNIACDGHFLPSIINHFYSAVTIYPNAKAITIEIGSTDYSIEELQTAALQPDLVDTRSTAELFEQQGVVSRVKNLIKENIPFISMVKSHLETARKTNSVGGGVQINEDEYRSVITECLTLIRSQTDVPIVFVYHPSTEIQGDGTVEIMRSQTLDIFIEVCENTGIDFIDTGDAFLEHYNEYHELPYGFANTTPGSGHLNEVGHKIMADAIIDYLEEVGCK